MKTRINKQWNLSELLLSTLKRKLFLRIRPAKTFNQPLNLFCATATSHCGIGLFFNFSHRSGPIHDGIDNIHLRNFITDTEVTV